MENEYKYDPILHISDVLDKVIEVQWQTANCPEECEAWSDWLEDYNRLLFSLVETLRGYRKEELENEKK